MRLEAALALLPFLIVLATGRTTSMNDIMGTTDYAMIMQERCVRYTEFNVTSTECPKSLAIIKNIPTYDRHCQGADTVRMHLIRDENNVMKPRVLYVFEKKARQIGYHVATIQFNADPMDFPSGVHSHVGPVLAARHEIFDTIFDTKSSILYIIVSMRGAGGEHRKLITVRVGGLFSKNGAISFTTMDREIAVNKDIHSRRRSWIEDPYSDWLYYLTTENDTTTIVHRISIQKAYAAIVEGIEGERVFQINDELRQLIWAHNDGYITSTSGTPAYRGFYIRQHIPNGSAGNRCKMDVNPARRDIIVLHGWDYCVIRHGLHYTVPCGAGPTTTVAPPVKDDTKCEVGGGGGGGNDTIYIVLIVLLSVTTLLLLIYAIWLRRNLDDAEYPEEKRPIQYYPSNKPLDSTFDMSVDRWDQY